MIARGLGEKDVDIAEIVSYWSGAQAADEKGLWMHRNDRVVFRSAQHSFNLQYPVSPYVGDIAHAPVIILGANAGFGDRTATEFPNADAIRSYVERVNQPRGADWTFVSEYYTETNYGHLIAAGKAALVNACAYRSRRISQEPSNRALLLRLPSVQFTRSWILDAVVPLARSGQRLIVAKRPGLWQLPKAVFDDRAIFKDNAPVNPRMSNALNLRVRDFLSNVS